MVDYETPGPPGGRDGPGKIGSGDNRGRFNRRKTDTDFMSGRGSAELGFGILEVLTARSYAISCSDIWYKRAAYRELYSLLVQFDDGQWDIYLHTLEILGRYNTGRVPVSKEQKDKKN